MTLFLKVLMVFCLALLLVIVLATGGLAAAIYASVGSGKSISASGPRIMLDELQSCSVILVDLDRIEIGLPDQLALLPGATEELVIATVPEVNLKAGLLPREAVDFAILGSDTCILSSDTDSWSVAHSSLGQPWLNIDATTGFTVTAAGTIVRFNANSAAKSTLIIDVTDPGTQVKQITLDAEISYPNANSWALGFATASSVLLIFFVALVVVVIVKKTKRPQP